MTSETFITYPCGRCGNRTRRRDYASGTIKYVDVCIMCGAEEYVEKPNVNAPSSLFKELRKKSYRLGLRKYRKNNDDEKFKGSPVKVAKKNIAALANCLAILEANQEEIEASDIIPAKDYELLQQILLKMFIRMDQLDNHLGVMGFNELKANIRNII